MAGHLSGVFPAEAVGTFKSMNIFINPADKGFPLTEGFELYVGAVGEEPNPKQQFRFDVVLNEPGIVDGKPLLETINRLTILVDDVVTALAPRLK